MMSFFLNFVLGAVIAVLILKNLIWVPKIPKLLHTPYARPGPWYASKIIFAKIWLAWKLIKHPRLLKGFKASSTKIEELGIVATQQEIEWEQPHQLKDMTSVDGLSFYGTDGAGTFLQVSINRLINRQAQVTFLLTFSDGTSYELPGAPDTLISNTDGKNSFNANGTLKFQMMEAMRKWRIIFNGIAKRSRDGKETEVHLRLNMLWTAFSRPFEFKREFSRKLLAQGMARERWRGNTIWSNISEMSTDGVDQWGTMCGTYQDNSLDDIEKELYFRGLRQRRWGQSNIPTLHRKLDIVGVCEDGNYFYLSATSDSSRLTHEVWGHVYHPSGFLYKINCCDLDLESLGETGPFPNHFSIRFSAKRRNYHSIIHLLPSQFDYFVGRPWQLQSRVHPCHLTLNSRNGRVIFVATNTFHGDCPLNMEVSVPQLSAPNRNPSSEESEKLVVLFNEDACRFDRLVGGKGSSLALLSSNSKTFPTACKVPAGFCVTVNAWNAQTKSDAEIEATFKRLQDVATGVVEGKLEECCTQAQKLLSTLKVESSIQDSIRGAIQELFGDDVEQKRVAVRSSAIGEDGEELSSAGQNTTVLGCKGFDAIMKGLQECWASLLSFQSVEYRRQHGEPLIPGMGVVIQEMVDADAAGVLFTVNPNDGNPGKMILTANFGLGESVVSASADPDTFYLTRTSSGELSIAERMVGGKRSKIVLGSDGTREESMSEETSGTLCLSDDQVLELGQLGVYLEKAFGGPRDLEFAVRGGELYLLQARPVTALDAWSDFELRHEFDSPILTDSDYVTKANVGEVLPGALSPLSLSVISKMLDVGIQIISMEQFGKSFEVNPWCNGRFTVINQGQVFLNVIENFQRDNEEEITATKRAVDMAVFGHLVANTTMHDIGKHRFGVAGWRVKLLRYKYMFNDMFFNNRRVQRASKKFLNFTIPCEQYICPQKLHDEICRQIHLLIEIGGIHLQVSRASSVSQLIAFIILLDGREEWTPDLYAEMAQLLSSISDVESADVPVALKQIAQAILKSEEVKEFASLAPDVAAVLLGTDPGPAGRLFRSFINRHGHRGIKEFDLATETWGMNHRLMVSVLQSMVSNPTSLENSQSNKSTDDWLKEKAITKPKQYRALKFFVPKCRDAVCAREKTKSMLIRTTHVFRLAYRRLAQLLVRDGKIPDADLIFYFTLNEIQELIYSNGAVVINKANRRRKLHPQLEALQFPELSMGVPQPEQQSPIYNLLSDVTGVQLKGTPVFKGIVKATARVALNLEEAKEIRNGDILITRSTDIGWSPYFPLVSGVVTELGGLISHGAVVAREYGLPAIVGCEKVTQVFRSGDLVILDGTKGTITRVDATQDN